MIKTVIITGGLGFIGSNIAKIFKQKKYYVIGIGHGFIAKDSIDRHDFDEWYQESLSLENLKKISRKGDTIVHCAGGSTVGISIAEPYLDYHKTVNSTLELLEFIRLYSPSSSLIYLSTAAVYGSKEDLPIKESDTTNPVSPYGFHKLASENICKSYAHCFGLKVSIVRLFSIYGEGLKKQLLWEACNKIMNANERVVFFGTGNETRDWLHVYDVATLVLQLANLDNSQSQIYNGSFGVRTTVKDILFMLRDLLGKNEIEIEFNQQHKEGDPQFYLGSTEKVLETGWVHTLEIDEGLKKYVNWYKLMI
ncbi:NAD-dependent epimerase/dehydratase family protein [Flavobacterium sp. XS2P39]|uniref:NAD-dependent epimerase/dehydratase family protein n=1 Tax=Flavobacterium sp. XS2P39 TaxID=3401725 RepID=UPI003AAC6BB2